MNAVRDEMLARSSARKLWLNGDSKFLQTGVVVKALAEIQVEPLGVGASVRNEVELAQQVLAGTRLRIEPHATGTNVEGDLAEVLAAVQELHLALHAHGVPRLSTTIRLDTRTDKSPDLDRASH